MKTLTRIIILSLIISTMISIGCNKETIEINSDQKSERDFKTAQNLRTLYYLPMYDEYGLFYGFMFLGCLWPSTNCLATVTITVAATDGSEPEVEKIEQAYENFTSSFNSDNVDGFFNTNQYEILFPQLSIFPDVLSGLRNAEISLHHDVGDDGLDYYICLPDSVDFSSDWSGLEKCVFVIDNQID